MKTRQRGFTLIELLVVVAIIALLIAILLPSLNRAREQAKKTTCAANLKAVDMSMAMYANQFNDWLPVYGPLSPPYSGPAQYAFIDVDANITDAVLPLAATAAQIGKGNEDTAARRLFYCPSNVTTGGVIDNYWSGFGANDKRVIGYELNTDRAGAGSGAFIRDVIIKSAKVGGPSGQPRTYPPLQAWEHYSSTPYPSSTELMWDIISSNGLTPPGSNIWTQFNFGGGNDSTSHMNGSLPAGMNTACFDGHVEWRPFNSDPNSYVLCQNSSTLDTYIMNPK